MFVKSLFFWGEPQNTCLSPFYIMNYSSVLFLILKEKKTASDLKRLFVTARVFLKSYFLCFLTMFEQQETSTVPSAFLP